MERAPQCSQAAFANLLLQGLPLTPGTSTSSVPSVGQGESGLHPSPHVVIQDLGVPSCSTHPSYCCSGAGRCHPTPQQLAALTSSSSRATASPWDSRTDLRGTQQHHGLPPCLDMTDPVGTEQEEGESHPDTAFYCKPT